MYQLKVFLGIYDYVTSQIKSLKYVAGNHVLGTCIYLLHHSQICAGMLT